MADRGRADVGSGGLRMPVRQTGICFLLLTVVAAPLGKPQAHYHHQQSAKWPQLQQQQQQEMAEEEEQQQQQASVPEKLVANTF